LPALKLVAERVIRRRMADYLDVWQRPGTSQPGAIQRGPVCRVGHHSSAEPCDVPGRHAVVTLLAVGCRVGPSCLRPGAQKVVATFVATSARRP
jgi:hypothetical protein